MTKALTQSLVAELGGPVAVAAYLTSQGRPLSHSAVCQWVKIPIEYCPLLEEWSGRQVTCERMRPDIKWAVLRNN